MARGLYLEIAGELIPDGFLRHLFDDAEGCSHAGDFDELQVGRAGSAGLHWSGCWRDKNRLIAFRFVPCENRGW
jgi:hypothetical protein